MPKEIGDGSIKLGSMNRYKSVSHISQNVFIDCYLPYGSYDACLVSMVRGSGCHVGFERLK